MCHFGTRWYESYNLNHMNCHKILHYALRMLVFFILSVFFHSIFNSIFFLSNVTAIVYYDYSALEIEDQKFDVIKGLHNCCFSSFGISPVIKSTESTDLLIYSNVSFVPFFFVKKKPHLSQISNDIFLLF